MIRSSRSLLGVGAAAVALAAGFAGYQTRDLHVVLADKKPVKLTYFDIGGRAMPVRAALRHAGVQFEDYRLKDFKELVALRGPTGQSDKIPFGVVPALEFPDGTTVFQTMSLLRWAGKKSDLYPKDDFKALLVDEVMESAYEMRNKLPEHKDAETLKQLREEYVNTTMPKYLTYLSRRLEQSKGPFLLGDQLSIADIVLNRLMDSFIQKRYDHVTGEVFAKYPRIMQHFHDTNAHSVIANEVKLEEERAKAKGAH